MTPDIGYTKDPVLKPWAAKQMQESNDEVLTGKRGLPFVAQSTCHPGGVPGQLLTPAQPIYFIQTPKEVWMVWQTDHMVRRIYLTDQHSENVKPSWFGESIGHYEDGDTLVIDTIGLQAHNSFLDWYRTPHSEKEHVVERYKLSADGKTLEALVTVEDPDTFNEPLAHGSALAQGAEPAAGDGLCREQRRSFRQEPVPDPARRHAGFLNATIGAPATGLRRSNLDFPSPKGRRCGRNRGRSFGVQRLDHHQFRRRACLLRQALPLFLGKPRRNPMSAVCLFDGRMSAFTEPKRPPTRLAGDIARLARNQPPSLCPVSKQLHRLRYARQIGLDNALKILDLPVPPTLRRSRVKPPDPDKHVEWRHVILRCKQLLRRFGYPRGKRVSVLRVHDGRSLYSGST